MDSDRLTASGFEDFVRVDGEIGSSNSEGSEESVVEERVADEIDEVNEEGEGERNQPYERKVLPEELSRKVMTLTCESTADGGSICDVYLAGTAHVSAESCQEVEAVINFLKPQVVFLELCSGCVAILTPQNLKVPTMGEMMGLVEEKSKYTWDDSWFLAKVANKLEVVPGAEFRVDYEEAMKYGGRVILGDRPVQLKEMDDVDMLTLVIQEMSKNFPTLWTTLVHERDLLFLLHQCTSIQLREFLQLQIRMTMNQTLGRVTCPESRITGNNPLR